MPKYIERYAHESDAQYQLRCLRIKHDKLTVALSDARTDCRELERSEKFLEGKYIKARDRGNRLAYLIERAKQVEERSTDPGQTQDETWMHRNEGFNEARRWFLMLLSDEDATSGETPNA